MPDDNIVNHSRQRKTSQLPSDFANNLQDLTASNQAVLVLRPFNQEAVLNIQKGTHAAKGLSVKSKSDSNKNSPIEG